MLVQAVKGSEVLMTNEIREKVLEQHLFFNDGDSYHWFFDFKVGDVWVHSKYISNDLEKCFIELSKL